MLFFSLRFFSILVKKIMLLLVFFWVWGMLLENENWVRKCLGSDIDVSEWCFF